MVSTKFRSPIFWPARRCAQCVRQRHALLAAGDDDRVVAERDVLGAERHRAQARAADLVDAPGGALLRQAGVDVRLARRVLPLARGQHLAEDRLGDLARRRRRRARAPPGSPPRRGRAPGVLAKAPLKLPTARARGRCDYDIGHRVPSSGGRAGPAPVVAPGAADESPRGASASPSSHKAYRGLNRHGRRGNRASGRQTWARAALPTTMPDVAGARPDRRARRGIAARQRLGQRRRGDGVARRRRRRAPAPRSRRGSTGPPRKRQPPVAVRLRICQPTSRSLARRAGIGTPSASQSSSATKSRAAGAVRVEPGELLELERRLHRVDQREEHLEERHRHQAEGGARAVEQRLGARRAPAARIIARKPPAMPRVEAKSQGAPIVTSAATASGAARGEPDGERAAHAVADHRHRAPGRRPRRGERRQQPLARRRRRGRTAPRAGPARPSRAAAGGSPRAASQRSIERPGREVEDVGAVDQARHHQHRRPVGIGRLGRRAVVEQPRAARLPDRRRVRQRAAVGMACQISRPRPSPAAARRSRGRPRSGRGRAERRPRVAPSAGAQGKLGLSARGAASSAMA